MAINFNGLTNYVDEQRYPLIKKAVLGGKTIGLINLQTGVKGAAAINLLNVDPAIQAGGCGWNAQGDAALSQRILDSKLLKTNMSFCDKDMRNYWMNYEVKIGAGKETLPFEEYFTTGVVEKIAEKLERMVWQGREEEGGFKGLLPILDETDRATATASDAYGLIKATYEAIPVEVLDKAVIFVGMDTFRSFMLSLVEKNLYHYPANGADVQEIIFPGTNTKVVAVAGLNGTRKAVGADPANLFFGCDMLEDAETFDIWYSKDNQEFRLAVQFNGATQVAYPNEVVVGSIE